MTRRGRMGGLAAILLLAGAAAFPYLLTRWSGASFCAADFRFVTSSDKVAAVLAHLEKRGSLTALERARIDPANCCQVDNGGRDLSPLGLENYLLGGLTHYVHVPEALIPRYPAIRSNSGIREGIFALTNCGIIRE